MLFFHVPHSWYLSCSCIYAYLISYLYIDIPHCITLTVQYISQNSWTKDHGTVLKGIKRCILVIPDENILYYQTLMLQHVQSAVSCLPFSLTNQIFHTRALCQNDLCEFCAKHCWHLDHAVKHVSLDNFTLTQMLNRSTVGISSSDHMHLRGWALGIIDLKTIWPQTPLLLFS